MASFSNSTEDDQSRKEIANMADEQSCHSSTVDIPPEIRRLHRVPTQTRAHKEYLYAPAFVPLGPFHHGKESFGQVEQLKNEALNIKLEENSKSFARGEFLKRAQEIRDFYGGVGAYDDNALAEMMLRDACFIVYYMEMCSSDREGAYHVLHRRGMSEISSISSDIYVLENQVPLWAIKLLLRRILIKGDDNDVEEFIWQFVSELAPGHEFWAPSSVGPWREYAKEQEPLHLIELFHTVLVKSRRSNRTIGSRNSVFGRVFKSLKWKSCCRDHETGGTSTRNYPARSVMDLKAKGIKVSPCPTNSKCLTEIRFESYWFFGKLLLPPFFINSNSKVFFSNLIAFEMSPETLTNFGFISYINFMQSLIKSPKDVEELREKGVLFSYLNDEQVMNEFKEIDTYGMGNLLFNDVKMKIDSHCRSRANMWMGELVDTYFRSPWSAIALFSTVFLLCLTFLQTIYAKKSVK